MNHSHQVDANPPSFPSISSFCKNFVAGCAVFSPGVSVGYLTRVGSDHFLDVSPGEFPHSHCINQVTPLWTRNSSHFCVMKCTLTIPPRQYREAWIHSTETSPSTSWFLFSWKFILYSFVWSQLTELEVFTDLRCNQKVYINHWGRGDNSPGSTLRLFCLACLASLDTPYSDSHPIWSSNLSRLARQSKLAGLF